MKLIPLRQWVCDSCGKVIDKPEDGWFEWYTEKNTCLDTGFRIVHQRESCMYNDRTLEQQNRSPCHLGLAGALGSSGLGYFLFKLELSGKGVHKLADIKEVAEIIRRLHLPYYEEARLYWDDALRDGFHDGCSFDESTLLGIIENYGADRPSS